MGDLILGVDFKSRRDQEREDWATYDAASAAGDTEACIALEAKYGGTFPCRYRCPDALAMHSADPEDTAPAEYCAPEKDGA